MEDKYESHMVTHNELQIDVKILKRSGVYIPMSFIVYRGSQAINHRLSDIMVRKIEGIVDDYCHNMNVDIN